MGLTRFVNKGHLARAVLEACAYQTLDIAEAMNQDSGVELASLKVDGGMVANELLMQFQADLLNVPVIRPKVIETTALGAAYAAGLAVGYLERFGRTQSQLGRRQALAAGHGRGREKSRESPVGKKQCPALTIGLRRNRPGNVRIILYSLKSGQISKIRNDHQYSQY